MFTDSPLVLFPLVAFGLCMVLHMLALRLFPRWGLLDFPERYGLARGRLPYPTGILAVIVFCLIFPILQPFTLQTTGLLFGVLLLSFACFADDRKPLSPWIRIGIQLVVAILLVACGIRVEAITNPLPFLFAGDSLVLNTGPFFAFSILFTILWLLLTINALNWFDGIPGQVSTLSTIAFVTIGLLSLSERVNQPTLALLAFTLAGISLGGLLFDFPPAHVVVGDSGAMFFGLMIGVLTIYSGGKVATAFLVLGVPLIDLFFVIIRRLRRGQSIFQGNADDQHLHHRLLKQGWKPRQIILLTAGIGAMFGVTALFLSTGGKVIAGLVLIFVMVLLSWYSGSRAHSTLDA